MRQPAAQRAEGQRGAGVHQHAGGDDEADQLLPAREGQEADDAGDERHDQAEPRGAALVDALEELRRVAVLAQAVRDARGRRGVDEAGAAGGDDGVEVQHPGQPAQADHGGEAGERAVDAGEVQLVPAVGEGGGGQRGDEDDLEQDVDDGADGDRAEHRARDVALGVLALAGQLDRLLEAQQGEDDAAGADRGEHALDAERGEAVRAEVGAVEVGHGEHEDREQRDEDLQPGGGAVGAGEHPDPEEVDRDEEAHQQHGDHEAAGGEGAVLVEEALRELPVPRVADHRLDLDRGDGGGLEPGEPAERHAREAAEGVVRVARRAAGDREHAAELGVHEGQQDDRDRADAPGDDRRRAGDDDGVLGSVEPTRADDRSDRGPHEADQADLAPERAVGGGAGGAGARSGRRELVEGSHAQSLCAVGAPAVRSAESCHTVGVFIDLCTDFITECLPTSRDIPAGRRPCVHVPVT